MSIEKDVARYSMAAEKFRNAGKFGYKNENRQEAIMNSLALKYFMTENEAAFYNELLRIPSRNVRIMAASDMGYMRYELDTAFKICQMAKIENWIFSEDVDIQKTAETYLFNTSNNIKDRLLEKKIYGDDRLFRQSYKYVSLMANYDDMWSTEKNAKTQETWQILLDYVKQIISEGKQDKFFDEMLENSQNFQKMITAMVSAALGYDKARSMRTLHSLVTNNSMSPLYLNFAAIQLERMKNDIPLDGLWK